MNLSIKDETKLFAVIDIETTGLNAGKEKITEIAILLHDGRRVLNEFSSLINPERKISYHITQLTGINDQMVSGAPKFYELARQIVELTENTIIVGHNVHFDYSFLKAEFLSLGFEFQRKTLDTVRLSRKLIPGQPSYSLGKLCNALHIENNARHRALGDATATAQLFALLYDIDPDIDTLPTKGLSANLNRSLVEKLPEKNGVYYLYNGEKELIYIGKANNIKARVIQHLNNNSTRKAVEMKQNIADVDFIHCGNELIALLLESDEIKKHTPVFNTKQRRSLFNYGLYHYVDDEGFIRLKVQKVVDELVPDYAYSSALEAKEHLFFLTEQFNLCQRLNGLYPGNGGCFQYQIGQCRGACCGKEKPEDYNPRVEEALERYHFEHENFYIFDHGRSADEIAVVKVEKGVYRGFGYVPANEVQHNLSELDDFIQSYPDNREVRQIIRTYLKKHKVLKLLPF